MCFYHTVLVDHTITKLNWHVPAMPLVHLTLTCRQLVLDLFQTYFFNKQNSAEDWRWGLPFSSICPKWNFNDLRMLHYYMYSPGCQTQIQKAYKGTLEKASHNTVTYQAFSNTHPPTQLSCLSLDLVVMFQPQHSLLPPPPTRPSCLLLKSACRRIPPKQG